jgi:hypothetical protein
MRLTFDRTQEKGPSPVISGVTLLVGELEQQNIVVIFATTDSIECSLNRTMSYDIEVSRVVFPPIVGQPNAYNDQGWRYVLSSCQ